MKSTITKLYDHTQSVIPDECLLWRITDGELSAQLETLSRNHAFEADVDTVQMGDSVACSSVSGTPRWNRAVMLFYPGRGICPAEVENACVGAKCGETRTVTMDGSEVALTVKRIVRRSNMPIGDELIRCEGIGGVETLEQYRQWYRQTNEPTRRLHAAYRAASFLVQEITDKSEFHLDEDEKREWLTDRVNRMYDALVDAGYDPKIPREGFDFLTEEQAKANMYAQQERFFTDYVAQSYLVETMTGARVADIVAQRLPALAEESNMTVEQIMKTSGFALVYGKYAYEAALEALRGYAEQFLEV